MRFVVAVAQRDRTITSLCAEVDSPRDANRAAARLGGNSAALSDQNAIARAQTLHDVG